MNEKVGQVGFPREDNGGFPSDKMYSEATAEVMDEEVRLIVAEAYQRTIRLMEERKEQVRLVAELLLEQETISHNDVAKLIGPRPFSAGKEYDEFVAHSTFSEDVKKETPEDSSSATSKEGGSGDGEQPVMAANSYFIV
jgi:AFG3 family protein